LKNQIWRVVETTVSQLGIKARKLTLDQQRFILNKIKKYEGEKTDLSL
jgi:hypothetical protein